jgi:hypothetical protein
MKRPQSFLFAGNASPSIKYRKPLLIRLQLIQMSDNSGWNMKTEKCYSELSAYFKQHMVFRKAVVSLCLFRQILTVSSNLHYYIQKQINFWAFYQ